MAHRLRSLHRRRNRDQRNHALVNRFRPLPEHLKRLAEAGRLAADAMLQLGQRIGEGIRNLPPCQHHRRNREIQNKGKRPVIRLKIACKGEAKRRLIAQIKEAYSRLGPDDTCIVNGGSN